MVRTHFSGDIQHTRIACCTSFAGGTASTTPPRLCRLSSPIPSCSITCGSFSQQPPFSGSTINQRIAVVDRALRWAFPDAPPRIAPDLQSHYWRVSWLSDGCFVELEVVGFSGLGFPRRAHSGFFRRGIVFDRQREGVCFRWIPEAISEPRLRQYVFGTRRIILDVLTKSADLRPQILGFLAILLAPKAPAGSWHG